MSIRRTLCFLTLPLFAGCQYFPHFHYFKAPENEPNPAWVRVVNFTQHADIYQYENGVRSGGSVRTGPLPFTHTQDVGMPKAGHRDAGEYVLEGRAHALVLRHNSIHATGRALLSIQADIRFGGDLYVVSVSDRAR